MKISSQFQQANDLIKKAKKIGLLTHSDGDADAFGSTLALGQFLEASGKELIYFSNEVLPDNFGFLFPEIEYLPKETFELVDLLIILDASTVKKLTLPAIITEAKNNNIPIIQFDHHQPLDIIELVDVRAVDPGLSSTCELIYDFAQYSGSLIDKTIATLLLFGIETDTYLLQNSNTSPKTFKVVADLVSRGAKLQAITGSIKGGWSIPSLKLLARVIARLELDEKTGTAITSILIDDKKELKLDDKSSSGVANFLDQLKEAKLVIVLEEKEEGMIKASMRSNNSDFDVNALANKFGGGGHIKAAGFVANGTVEEIRKKVLKAI